MAPGVTVTVKDFGLGLAPASTAKVQLKFGVAALGLVNKITSAGDLNTLTALLGKGGPLVEAAALALQLGAPVYCVPVNPSTYGTAGAVTKAVVGTGSTSTLAVAPEPSSQIIAKIAASGTLGVATVQFSTDGGATYGAAVATAATVMVPQATLVTLAFAAGAYVAGDTTIISTAGSPTFSGSGFNGCTFSSASPLDAYSLIVTCSVGGALGAAQFSYSLDNGNTSSGTLLVPASGKYIIPDTGLLLTFANALVATDAWTCSTTPAAYSTTDLTNAMNALAGDARTWGFCHVVGAPSTSSAAATLLATLDSLLTTAAASFRYARGLIEVADDTDANLIAAFAASATLRAGACAGTCYVISPLNGRQMVRSSAWPVAARAGAVPLSEDLGRVASGALTGVSLLAANPALPKLRDEAATPGLDVARFTTLTSFIGKQGVYITSGRLMAPSQSDYTYWPNGRVMDAACRVSRNTLLNYVNTQLRVNGLTAPGNPGDPGAPGTLLEKEARGIEVNLDDDLRSALTRNNPPDANDVAVAVSRIANILTTSNVPVAIAIQPDAYSRTLTETIQFAVAVSS